MFAHGTRNRASGGEFTCSRNLRRFSYYYLVSGLPGSNSRNATSCRPSDQRSGPTASP